MSVVQSVVGQVPRLIYSNGQLGNSRDLIFFDFVGLGCKSSSSRRSRRRVGVSSTSRSTRGLLGKNWSSSSIRAVLDVERGTSSPKVSNYDDSKPKHDASFGGESHFLNMGKPLVKEQEAIC